jgi:DNA-binding transcriptional ArsR family regulator
MVTANKIAGVAATIGEPARAAILTALLDGRALTAAELAGVAGVTPQTASAHLSRLIGAELVKVEKQGRHRYHRLASAVVARMLEGLGQHTTGAGLERLTPQTGPRDEAMRRARTCYDHLAGKLGVAIADALVGHGYVEIDDEGGVITEEGATFFHRAGIVPPDGVGRTRRWLCRPCLDWNERRPHLAGRLGAAICAHGFEAGWLRRIDGTRAVSITVKGEAAIARVFGIAQL